MPDRVKHKTVNATEGVYTVPIGVSVNQILSVWRQGILHDKTTLLLINSSNRSWSFIPVSKRIVFKSDQPFAAGEKIKIIYKVTL